MNTWNYRVLQHEGNFAIHEVYYEDGKPTSCTEDPVAPFGEDTVEELRRDMELMMRALNEPVLNYKDFTDNNNPPPSEIY
jgi:hypothetical protein